LAKNLFSGEVIFRDFSVFIVCGRIEGTKEDDSFFLLFESKILIFLEDTVMEKEALKEEVKKSEEVVEQEKGSEKKSRKMSESILAKMRTGKKCVAGMSRTTKSFAVVIIVFALLSIAFYSFKSIFIVATVNGNPVSRLSVVKELESKAGKNILDTMITKKLINEEMRKSGIVIKSEDIDVEMKKIEDQVATQGGTLEEALVAQGMTAVELREQIIINKQLEQVLADKVVVSDDEVNQYLATKKTVAPKGANSEDMKNQVREQLKGQKFNTEAEKWVSDIKAKANIIYFVKY